MYHKTIIISALYNFVYNFNRRDDDQIEDAIYISNDGAREGEAKKNSDYN